MVTNATLNIVFFLFFTTDFLLAWDSIQPKEWAVNAGQNVTLPCFPYGSNLGEQVMWVKDDRSERMKEGWILEDGSLNLPSVSREDSGSYTCARDDLNSSSESEDLSATDLSDVDDAVLSKYHLIVRTVPGPLGNVTVRPSTVLALLLWELGDTGDCDITYFTARYRPEHSDDWIDVIPNHISPNTRQIDIYHLTPNTTYVFQVWATNEIGESEKVTLEATTRHVIEEIELARHLLEGVESFDTRVWVVAVAVVMGTLVLLSFATCYLMLRDYHVTVWSVEDHETMELVPNITLNPGYGRQDGRDRLNPDENSNDLPRVAFNNNSIVRPTRV